MRKRNAKNKHTLCEINNSETLIITVYSDVIQSDLIITFPAELKRLRTSHKSFYLLLIPMCCAVMYSISFL